MTDNQSSEERSPTLELLERVETLLRLEPADIPTELQASIRELIEQHKQTVKAKDRYAALYEFAPFAYLTLIENGTIVEANLNAESLLGVKRDSLIGTTLSSFLSAESKKTLAQHLDQAFKSDKRSSCEVEFADDTKSYSVRLESIGQDSETGRICRTAMVDITYGKTAEKIVRESEARLQRLNETLEQRVAKQTKEVRLLAEAISHLGEGVLITDDDLDWPGPRIMFVNEAMCRMSGYRKDELIGKTPRFMQGADTDRESLDRIKAELSAGQASEAELINYRKDGSSYHVELFITPLFDDQGRRTNFVSINRDVTERKRAEEALQHSHEFLERRVKKRTAALEEANAACQNANAIKTRFLTAASHDLRQPLQSVELYLSVLSTRLGRSDDQEICEKIRKSLESVHELLDALLDVSRFESGTIAPEKQDFGLRQLLDRIVTDNSQQAKVKGLELVAVPTDCRVHSDPALLERVIENFVTNAIRYTERGSIVIECEPLDKTVRISVRDTGIGIPEDAFEPIFNDYYQLDNPMRDRRKGLGLGLSIVKHIARLLDHKIEVHSTPGEGSTFSVEVPLGNIEAGSPEVPNQHIMKRDSYQAPLILFVDDDPAIVDAMTMLLKSTGFHYRTASNGDEALAGIEGGIRPDLIICDYRLPGSSGIEVVSRVREMVSTCIPAVLMTGDTSLQEIKAHNLPECAIVHKPVETDQLIATIEKLTAK